MARKRRRSDCWSYMCQLTAGWRGNVENNLISNTARIQT
jgi:hypothetical protein